MVKVGIVGATGYAGVELVRILLNHPKAELTAISSVSFEGKPLSAVYPNLRELCDMQLKGDDIIDLCDVVFASLPHGLSEPLAEKCFAKSVKFIDLGADFRLVESDYQEWYGKSYANKDLHNHSVYCIPELHRDRLKGKIIVGNPGCYPTSITLGLAPLMKSGLCDVDTLIIDSKSGVTGAGKSLSDNTHYPNCNEAFAPYKVASHRHTPEIEQNLSQLANKDVKVTFVPHLLPLNRGIISTMYCKVNKPMSAEEIKKMYDEFYKNEKFVRVLPLGSVANLRDVRMSNYCDISVHYDERTSRAVIVSAIDNMVKGAAGQAIQNMNILFDLEEDCGLNMIPCAF